MKKILLGVICFILLAITADAQPYLRVDNQTGCNVWVDFYCRNRTTCAGPIVQNNINPVPAASITTFDATAIAGVPLGTTHGWQYGLIGNLAGCAPQAPGGGCVGNHIQITNGTCVGPVTLSGCVNVDAACNGGCATLNVTATYYPNGDCDLLIN